MLYYKLRSCKHPLKEGERYYRAQLLGCTPVDISDFYQELAQESCVTSADVKAVLDRLERTILHYLKDGKSVRLGTLGSFHLTMQSKSVEEREMFGTEHIKSVRVKFMPSPAMKRQVALTNPNVRLSLVSSMG